MLIRESETSDKQIAAELGIGHGVITEWRKGRNKPGTEAIVKLADYFNVSADYLLGRTDSKEPVFMQGKKKEPSMWFSNKKEINIMDIDTFIKDVREKNSVKEKHKLKGEKNAALAIEEATADFNRFFKGYGFDVRVSSENDKKCSIQAILDDIGESAITLTYVNPMNERAMSMRSGEIIDFVITILHPKKAEFKIAVCLSSEPNARFVYHHNARDTYDFTGTPFNSMHHVLEDLFPSSKDAEIKRLEQQSLASNQALEDERAAHAQTIKMKVDDANGSTKTKKQ